MAWTNFPTFAVGHISSAADWNTYIAGNANFLSIPPFVRVYRNAASTGGSAAPAPYDTIHVADTTYPTAFSVSTHNYTVPVNGTYIVTAAWSQTGTADGQVLAIEVLHNGVLTANFYGTNFGGVGTQSYQCQDLVGPCATGDTLAGGYVASQSLATVVGQNFSYMWILKVSN